MTGMTQVCRSCRGTLDPFLDLGYLQLSGYLAPGEEARPTAPLTLAACSDCRLVQLLHTTPRELLFHHYWYRSGVNEVMRAELADVVRDAVTRVELGPGDVVLDTGANDGTLLAAYASHQPGLLRVAFEPAVNLQPTLRRHADLIVADYFPSQYTAIKQLEGRVKILTSIAMFYAVEDIARFLAAVASLLDDDGVWIVQLQDLASMVRMNAFDNICHEHLMYYSVQTFRQLLAPYDLVLTRVEERAINGGSVRLFVRHAHYVPQPNVMDALLRETAWQTWASFEHFAQQVSVLRRHIYAAVAARVKQQQVVDLYGASTKANTLLQVCGLSQDLVRQAWERSPEKVGRRTAGSDIPIVSEADGRDDPPDALLVGIWQFKDAVVRREHAYLDDGGTLILPLPHLDIITTTREVDRVGA